MRFGERTAAEIRVRFLGDVRAACEATQYGEFFGGAHTTGEAHIVCECYNKAAGRGSRTANALGCLMEVRAPTRLNHPVKMRRS